MKGDLLGPSGHPRLAHEAYFTIDPLAVDTLAKAFDLHGLDVWEPAAGRGHLARDLARHGAVVSASDLVAYDDPVFANIYTPENFFAVPDYDTDAIITNPPARLSTRFLAKALTLCPHGYVALLLRHEWICRKGASYEARLRMWIPIRGRLRWVEGSTEAPRHNWAWGVWGPSRSGKRRSRLVL